MPKIALLSREDGFLEMISKVIPPKYNHFPRTGLQAIVLALHMCQDITIYGFRVSEDNKYVFKYPFHYYDEIKATRKIYQGSWHSVFGEYKVINKLRNAELIKVQAEFYPEEIEAQKQSFNKM